MVATPVTEIQQMTRVLAELDSHPNARLFYAMQESIKGVALSEPKMTLRVVKDKLEKQLYTEVSNFVDDMTAIFSSCPTNGPLSSGASSMKTLFGQILAKHTPQKENHQQQQHAHFVQDTPPGGQKRSRCRSTVDGASSEQASQQQQILLPADQFSFEDLFGDDDDIQALFNDDDSSSDEESDEYDIQIYGNFEQNVEEKQILRELTTEISAIQAEIAQLKAQGFTYELEEDDKDENVEIVDPIHSTGSNRSTPKRPHHHRHRRGGGGGGAPFTPSCSPVARKGVDPKCLFAFESNPDFFGNSPSLTSSDSSSSSSGLLHHHRAMDVHGTPGDSSSAPSSPLSDSSKSEDDDDEEIDILNVDDDDDRSPSADPKRFLLAMGLTSPRSAPPSSDVPSNSKKSTNNNKRRQSSSGGDDSDYDEATSSSSCCSNRRTSKRRRTTNSKYASSKRKRNARNANSEDDDLVLDMGIVIDHDEDDEFADALLMSKEHLLHTITHVLPSEFLMGVVEIVNPSFDPSNEDEELEFDMSLLTDDALLRLQKYVNRCLHSSSSKQNDNARNKRAKTTKKSTTSANTRRKRNRNNKKKNTNNNKQRRTTTTVEHHDDVDEDSIVDVDGEQEDDDVDVDVVDDDSTIVLPERDTRTNWLQSKEVFKEEQVVRIQKPVNADREEDEEIDIMA